MKRITFINQKGGVGKTSVSILIGSALRAADYNVAFEDRDSQGTLAFWAREVGEFPLVEENSKPDIVICDTPGRLDLNDPKAQAFFSGIVQESDRVVVVSEKSMFSTHATLPMIEVVKQHKKPSCKIGLLFNKVRANTTVGNQDESELSKHLGIKAYKHSLPLAACYENLQALGFKAVTGKHREMVLNLALEILK